MKPSEAVEKLAKLLASFEFPKKDSTIEYQIIIMRFLFDHDLTILERSTVTKRLESIERM